MAILAEEDRREDRSFADLEIAHMEAAKGVCRIQTGSGFDHKAVDLNFAHREVVLEVDQWELHMTEL